MALSPIDAFDLIQRLDEIPRGIGDWVANGTPSNPVAQAIQQRYRDQCDSYSNAPSWFKAGVQLAPATSRTMSNLCDPWLGSQGSGGPIAVPGSVADQFDGEDLSKYGGARIVIRRGAFDLEDITENVIRWEVSFNEFTQSERLERWDCDDSRIGITSFESIEILEWGVCGGATEPPPGPPPPGVEPNPNPRPDPGLQPEDEPYVDPVFGTPRFPLPSVENPFGEPIELPPSYDPSDPTAGEGTGGTPPPPSPGDEITPDGDGDTDFGEPPEGERWVGCCIEITSSPIGAGSIPGSAPYLIYPRVVGNARLKLSNNTVDSPCQIRSKHICLWESIEGQSPTGVFVNLLPNYSYKVIPYSVPIDPPPENA